MLTKTLEGWQSLLKTFKEKLAQRLWSLPTVSEAEKETVFKEYLSDLDLFESELEKLYEDVASQQNILKDENELLRSLMGVPEDELRARTLTLGQDLAHANKKGEELSEELDEVKRQLAESTEENKQLRKRLNELEDKSENLRLQEIKKREDDIKFFSESQEALKNQLKDLDSRMGNLKHLFTENNQQLLVQKQDEISLLQKNLLQEMEATLRKKQQLSWMEEDMFAKGVAHRVRTALVSAQGQLYLTLERLGLMDPETKNETFWKSRLKLLIEGADELSKSFKSVTAQLQEVTSTLDDYLHLTGRRDIVKEPVDLKELVQKQMAEVYHDRRPTLSLEFLSDDPLPLVIGDKELLQFVFKTLFQNAFEALPHQSGSVSINLKNMFHENRVRMVVRDSGQGIPTPMAARVFQPFFTTKEGRQGLSLSRAKRYAEVHGGSLQLVRSGSEGTIFELELPIQGAS